MNKSNLERHEIEKIIIPSNKIDIYTRSEIVLGVKISGRTNTLTEASNLMDEVYKRNEIQNEQKYRIALDILSTYEMELRSKKLREIAFNMRPKIEEHMLIVMDKSNHEEHLSQPVQSINKQFKIAVTFPTGYNGIFNVTSKNNNFYFPISFSDIEPSFNIIPPGAYELGSLDAEIERICINVGHLTDDDYPFKLKPNFSTLGGIIDIDVAIGGQFSSMHNDSIGDLIGLKWKEIHKEYKYSDYPVDILSFDNIYLECDIAQGIIFWGKLSNFIHNFTLDVDPGYEYNEKKMRWCSMVYDGIKR